MKIVYNAGMVLALVGIPTTVVGPVNAFAGGVADVATNANGMALGAQINDLAQGAGNFIASIPQKTGCDGGNVGLCAMAALSVAQGIMSLMGSSGAGKTAAATAYDPGTGQPVGPSPPSLAAAPQSPGGTYDPLAPSSLGNAGPPSPTLPSSGALLTSLHAQQAALAAKGYSVSPDGSKVTLPSGKSIATSDFASDAGFKAMGLSESQIADVKAKNAQIQVKVLAELKKMGLEDGGSGGGGGGFARPGVTAGGFAFGRPQINKKDLSARSAFGMTKSLNGSQIGVSGDDLFQMVSRQYQRRDHDGQFLK